MIPESVNFSPAIVSAWPAEAFFRRLAPVWGIGAGAADQADSGDGGDGFVSLCYINHGNLAGEWLMCFRRYT